MPIDASIPYEALKGLQTVKPYDPLAEQMRLQRVQQPQGPNAALLRYGQEQQENQQIAALAQQYGDDYDGMSKAIIAKFPHRADVVAGIETALKDGAEKHLEMTKSSRAELQSRIAELQGASDDATWQPVAQGIVKDFPRLTPMFAGKAYTPELQRQIVGIGQCQDQWLDAQEKADLALTLNDARRHLTPAERERLKKERAGRVSAAAGMSTRAIAKEEGVSNKTVHLDKETSGVTVVTPETPTRVTGLDSKTYPAKRDPEKAKERRTRVVEARSEGKKLAEIAKEEGVSVGPITQS